MSLNSVSLNSSWLDGEIQTIFVPAGAEYRAVQAGLKKAVGQRSHGPRLVVIPAGPQAVESFLASWEDLPQLAGGVLLMGLGGSLSLRYAVGEGVMVEQIWRGFEGSGADTVVCDKGLTGQIAKKLGLAVETGVTCDRIITTADEKQTLGDRFSAQVVDMEGFALLRSLPECKVAMLRVMSDGCDYDLPDISNAINPDGSLNSMALMRRFAMQPVAAQRLVRGSLKGLRALKQIARRLVDN
ncbi:MAG: hypothetical protein WA883_12110 [Phormidesmis sp.]